ncbi:2-isopropylmalate synthase [Methermicoccus shengliensis]|uniref:2-isopropylmalate synthase n=1 Tax=Methermicoccus shengliensis TaxID=660064 RepID=UPI00076C796C|nr:MAG: putative 2-isopropylmalate synthase [Euryarchaeota archaeon 55_53]KUK29737.1 MAG: putative 2-isopropylmalate synthase [Methanosarcinales archeaon 56_1174]MDI3487795.1 2-isopropylmalate synthase [Methanosarcinales archaeon]MDN5294848.1 2-isopropylmalate synthase [Methanosarcinales archaeon]
MASQKTSKEEITFSAEVYGAEPEFVGREVSVFDTTLRDGEQTPGVSLTIGEKFIIARQLEKLGVDVIEAGFPRSSPGEKQTVKKIANAGLDPQVCGLARVLKPDIDACVDADVDMVHIFVSTSDIQRLYTIKKSREEVLEMAVDAVHYVKEHGLRCMFSAMDATRTDLEYLVKVYTAVEEAGADIINVPDTVGIMTPARMRRLIEAIVERVSIPVDVHCHNDFGLAVANTLAAFEAGASEVQVTINGLGERGGNADLAETVMSLHCLYGAKTNIRTQFLVETARLVERHTGIPICPTRPVVGDNAFAHESGIHTAGVIERSDTFEPGVMTPEMVGHVRRIVVGKHAGRHAVNKALVEAGYFPDDSQLTEIMSRIKELGDKGKRITDADLFAIADSVIGAGEEEERVVDLKEVTVMTGNLITPTAVVKAVVGGIERTKSDTGVGPVDAAVKAVQSMIGEETNIKIHDFRIEAITGGSDALADVIIGVEDENGHIVSARAAREDIVMASVDALVSALNRLLKKQA